MKNWTNKLPRRRTALSLGLLTTISLAQAVSTDNANKDYLARVQSTTGHTAYSHGRSLGNHPQAKASTYYRAAEELACDIGISGDEASLQMLKPVWELVQLAEAAPRKGTLPHYLRGLHFAFDEILKQSIESNDLNRAQTIIQHKAKLTRFEIECVISRHFTTRAKHVSELCKQVQENPDLLTPEVKAELDKISKLLDASFLRSHDIDRDNALRQLVRGPRLVEISADREATTKCPSFKSGFLYSLDIGFVERHEEAELLRYWQAQREQLMTERLTGSDFWSETQGYYLEAREALANLVQEDYGDF